MNSLLKCKRNSILTL